MARTERDMLLLQLSAEVSGHLATPSILDTGRPKPQERTDAAP